MRSSWIKNKKQESIKRIKQAKQLNKRSLQIIGRLFILVFMFWVWTRVFVAYCFSVFFGKRNISSCFLCPRRDFDIELNIITLHCMTWCNVTLRCVVVVHTYIHTRAHAHIHILRKEQARHVPQAFLWHTCLNCTACTHICIYIHKICTYRRTRIHDTYMLQNAAAHTQSCIPQRTHTHHLLYIHTHTHKAGTYTYLDSHYQFKATLPPYDTYVPSTSIYNHTFSINMFIVLLYVYIYIDR